MNAEPLVRVVRGTPTAAELAALVVVLTSRSMDADSYSRRPSMSAWVRSARPGVGPGSWRTSGLPS